MATRVAIIGAGRIAAHHLRGYQHAGAEVVAIADVDVGRARDRAEPFGAVAYTDFREMLKHEQLDAVSICTPPNLHFDQLIECARVGVAVLSEKPFALSVDEAREMLKKVREAETLLAVNFAHRHYEGTDHVRQLIKSGQLGKIHSLHVRFGVDYTQSERQWIFDRSVAGGGAFMDTASHAVDLFRYLVGEVDSVFAVERHGRQDIEVEDLGVLVLEQSSADAVGIIEADWSTPGPDYRWSIHGSGGAAFVEYLEPGMRYRLHGESEWTDVQLSPEARFARFDSVVADFVGCVRDGGTPRAVGEDGARALEIISAAYESVKTRCATDCSSALGRS